MKRNPVKRIPKCIEVEKKTPKWLEIITAYEPFFSLVVAFLAIGISIYAMYDSNNTSIENTKQLEKISKLIDKQIEITNRQLHDQILSGVPVIQVDDIMICDTNNFFKGMYAPKINVIFRNVGLRTAYMKSIRIYAVYIHNGIDQVCNSDNKLTDMICGPNSTVSISFLPKMMIGNRDQFFVGVDVEYLDKYTEELFYAVKYSSFGEIRGELKFSTTNDYEKQLINEYINKSIDEYNKINLKQEKHFELEPRTPNFNKLMSK